MNQIAIIKRATGQRAAECAVMLVAKYPAMKLENPDVFMTDLRNLIQGYPDEILERALVHIPKTIPKYKFELHTVKMELDNLAKPTYEKLRLQKEAQQAEEKRRTVDAIGAEFTKECNAWQALNPGKRLREMASTYRPKTEEEVQAEKPPWLSDELQARSDAEGEGAALRSMEQQKEKQDGILE